MVLPLSSWQVRAGQGGAGCTGPASGGGTHCSRTGSTWKAGTDAFFFIFTPGIHAHGPQQMCWINFLEITHSHLAVPGDLKKNSSFVSKGFEIICRRARLTKPLMQLNKPAPLPLGDLRFPSHLAGSEPCLSHREPASWEVW